MFLGQFWCQSGSFRTVHIIEFLNMGPQYILLVNGVAMLLQVISYVFQQMGWIIQGKDLGIIVEEIWLVNRNVQQLE